MFAPALCVECVHYVCERGMIEIVSGQEEEEEVESMELVGVEFLEYAVNRT